MARNNAYIETRSDSNPSGKPSLAKAFGMTLEKMDTLSIIWVPLPVEEKVQKGLAHMAKSLDKRLDIMMAQYLEEAIEDDFTLAEAIEVAYKEATAPKFTKEQLEAKERQLMAQLDQLKKLKGAI